MAARKVFCSEVVRPCFDSAALSAAKVLASSSTVSSLVGGFGLLPPDLAQLSRAQGDHDALGGCNFRGSFAGRLAQACSGG